MPSPRCLTTLLYPRAARGIETEPVYIYSHTVLLH